MVSVDVGRRTCDVRHVTCDVDIRAYAIWAYAIRPYIDTLFPIP